MVPFAAGRASLAGVARTTVFLKETDDFGKETDDFGAMTHDGRSLRILRRSTSTAGLVSR